MVYGLAAASGAALGGVMADTLGWRWEFGVQVFPLAGCFALAAWTMPPDLGLYVERETFVEAVKAFDWTGTALLTSSSTFLILGLVRFLYFLCPSDSILRERLTDTSVPEPWRQRATM